MLESELLEILENELPNHFFLDKDSMLKCMLMAFELGKKECEETNLNIPKS